MKKNIITAMAALMGVVAINAQNFQDKKDLIINTFDSVKTNSTILNYLISKRCTQLIECAEEFNSL